jgi:hypothetical protein
MRKQMRPDSMSAAQITFAGILSVFGLGCAPVVAQRADLPTAVATNVAELRLLTASTLLGGFARETPRTVVVGAEFEVWISSQGRPDSLRYHAPIGDSTYFSYLVQAEIWRHGVFEHRARGWHRWRLEFDVGQLAPTEDESRICPTTKAIRSVLDLVLRAGAADMAPDTVLQVEVGSTILRPPHCEGVLAEAVSLMQAEPRGARAVVCLEPECNNAAHRRRSFRIDEITLKWLTSSWELKTSDGRWYIDCPISELRYHPKLGECIAGEYWAIW